MENIGIIPHRKDGLSSENYLDEPLCGEMDDDSEFISPDAIFSDTSGEKGMANFIDKDFTTLCDLSAKSPNRINGNNKTNNLSGWEASTMPDSQTDAWACSTWENKETGDQKSVSQLKTATGWDTNSPVRERHCIGGWTERTTALQASEDPDFPPGFSSVKGSYKEEGLLMQQIESETSFPSGTDILKTSTWKDYADEQGEHKLCSCDNKSDSDNTLKSELATANLILGKVSPGGIHWEAHSRVTSQDLEQGQRTSQEAQANVWSVDRQADVSEISCTIPEERCLEAQDTSRIDQRISEETQPTGWNVDWQAEITETSWTTPEAKVEGLSKARPLGKNVFEQEHVGHDKTREPLRVGNLELQTKLKENKINANSFPHLDAINLGQQVQT